MPNTKYYVSKEKLGLYDEKIKKYIDDADDVTLKAAKDYADGLVDNYDEAGAAQTALSKANEYTDGQVEIVQGAAEAAQTAADAAAAAATQAAADAATAQANLDKEIVRATTKENEIYDAVGEIFRDYVGKAEKTELENSIGEVDNKVDDLAILVGTLPEGTSATDVVDYVDIKTAGIATDVALEELQNQLGGVQGAIEALEGADEDHAGRIQTLEDQITGLSGAMHFKGVITGDALPESTTGYENGDVVIFGNKEYVVNNGAFVEFGDVGAQAEAITALITRADGVDAKIEEIEGDISDLEIEVGNKVAKTDYDAKIDELEQVDTFLNNKLTSIDSKVDGNGEGSVAARIDAAKQEAISVAAGEADTKDASLKTAITNEYKSYVDEADNAIKERLDLVEDNKHTHSNKGLLDTYTQTEANLADAVNKKHEHANADVINAIEAPHITTWNTVTSKASQADLDSATVRIDTLEAWHNAFSECSEDDINNLFI